MSFKHGLLACAFAAAPGFALAQPGSGIIDQNRPDRAPPRAPQTGETLRRPSGAAQIAAPDTGGTAVALRGVDIQGSTLPHAKLVAAMHPFLGRRLDKPTIQAAADALSALYARSKVALYTIQAPQQDLSGGRLRLQVTEGHIAQVAIRGQVKGRQTALVKAYALKLTDEKPLSRPTLERELSLINDIPGMKTTPQLLQGRSPGDVVLDLDLAPKRTDFDVGLLNSGTPQLGRYQVQADFDVYGLLRAGDATRLTLLVPTDLEKFQYYGLTHSQALGDNGLRAQVSVGYLRTRPTGGAGGDATTAAFQLSYPLIRSYQENLYLTGDVDGIDSSNAVLGQAPSSEQTRAARLAAAWTVQRPTHGWVVSGTGTYGETKLGGATPVGAADDTYSKFNLRLGYDQGFGPHWIVRTKAIAQLSGNRLPASELFSLGGDDFGRAFTQSTLLGDEGEAASIELAMRPGWAPKPLAGSEIYAFTDAGRVKVASRFGLPGQRSDLGSAGLGVRAVWKQKTVVDLEGAYATESPFPRQNGGWRLGFSFRTVQ